MTQIVIHMQQRMARCIPMAVTRPLGWTEEVQ